MSENKTTQYMMLFRGGHWDEGVSAEEVQRRMSQVMAWFEGLKNSGKVKGAQPLGPEQVTISSTKSGGLHDGPFAESKEAVGGYLILEAESMEAAVAIARTNPSIAFGISVEVRPVLEECPVFERAKNRELTNAAA